MIPDIDVPRAALIGFVLLVGAAFVVGGATSGVAFDAFNPDWDGTSDLRTAVEQTDSEPIIVRNTTRYNRYGANTTAFVISPAVEYTATDVARIRAYLNRGGTLVIAERDGSYGQALLAALGANARPAGPILRDERNYYRSPALPIATEPADHPLVEGVETLTLNYGTAVEPNGATVLVSSSEYAYLDRDSNEQLSVNETLTSYPVATAESIGNGTVVTVGDPSLFINAMQERDGNRAFSRALIDGTDHSLIDISHAGSPPPLVAALLAIQNSIILQLGIGIGGLGLLRAGSVYFRPQKESE
jgi:hypothetical protein